MVEQLLDLVEHLLVLVELSFEMLPSHRLATTQNFAVCAHFFFTLGKLSKSFGTPFVHQHFFGIFGRKGGGGVNEVKKI